SWGRQWGFGHSSGREGPASPGAAPGGLKNVFSRAASAANTLDARSARVPRSDEVPPAAADDRVARPFGGRRVGTGHLGGPAGERALRLCAGAAGVAGLPDAYRDPDGGAL